MPAAASSAGDAGWAVFEEQSGPGGGSARHRRPPQPQRPLVQLQLRRQPAAAGGVCVAFDDEQQQQLKPQEHQRQEAGVGQTRLSEQREGGGSEPGVAADDPWLELEQSSEPERPGRQQPFRAEAAAAAGQQTPGLAAGGGRRVPTFAARRQPLALSQSDQQALPQAATCMPGIEDDEEWDGGMLEQVTSEQAAATADE